MKKYLFTIVACAALLFASLCSVALAQTKDAMPRALVEQRADPSLYKAKNGEYYFVASVPEYDRIELRSSKTLSGIGAAPAQVIWKKHATGVMGANIWAPEITHVNGVWYIYFAAGDAEQIWRIRMYVLANKSADPTKGVWQELGVVKTARDSFSLDSTVFEHKGQHYYLWAQQDAEQTVNSAIYIARLMSPTKVGALEAKISMPTLDWEMQGYKVNEGPAVLKRNGKIFISYSASATDHRYLMGLLWADENADLLDPTSWHKSPVPVFSTNEKLHRYGPGHNSFVVADDGKTDVLVYHARDYRDLKGTPLTDPNRHTYVRKIRWTKEGFPDFGQDKANDPELLTTQ